MGGWWTAHLLLRLTFAVALASCALYCLARLLASSFHPAVRRAGASRRASDAGHAVMNGLMAVTFLPVGDHLTSGNWTLLFAVLAAGFAVAIVHRRLGADPARRGWLHDTKAGYHLLCAGTMVYLLAGMPPGSGGMAAGVMSGGRAGAGALAIPLLGWLLVAVLGVDAAMVVARIASPPAVVAAPGTTGSYGLRLLGTPWLAPVPHLTMDAAMAAMLTVALIAR